MKIDRTRILQFARKLVSVAPELCSNSDKESKSGHLFVCELNGYNLNTVVSESIGATSCDRKYRRFAWEKAFRLASDVIRDPNSVSSWQTRDANMDRYGGAVALRACAGLMPPYDIFSFSGSSQHTDEAICLNLVTLLGMIDDETANEIAKISGNKVFDEMRHEYQKRFTEGLD